MLRESKHDLGDPKVHPVRLFVDAIRGLWQGIVTHERQKDLRDVKEQISGDVTKVHVDRWGRVRQRVDMIERGVRGEVGDAGAGDAVIAGAGGTDEAHDGTPHRCRPSAPHTRVVGVIYYGSIR